MWERGRWKPPVLKWLEDVCYALRLLVVEAALITVMTLAPDDERMAHLRMLGKPRARERDPVTGRIIMSRRVVLA